MEEGVHPPRCWWHWTVGRFGSPGENFTQTLKPKPIQFIQDYKTAPAKNPSASWIVHMPSSSFVSCNASHPCFEGGLKLKGGLCLSNRLMSVLHVKTSSIQQQNMFSANVRLWRSGQGSGRFRDSVLPARFWVRIRRKNMRTTAPMNPPYNILLLLLWISPELKKMPPARLTCKTNMV